MNFLPKSWPATFNTHPSGAKFPNNVTNPPVLEIGLSICLTILFSDKFGSIF